MEVEDVAQEERAVPEGERQDGQRDRGHGRRQQVERSSPHGFDAIGQFIPHPNERNPAEAGVSGKAEEWLLGRDLNPNPSVNSRLLYH